MIVSLAIALIPVIDYWAQTEIVNCKSFTDMSSITDMSVILKRECMSSLLSPAHKSYEVTKFES